MIYNEVFDSLYKVLAAGRGALPVQDPNARTRRINRAMLAMQCQNYFLETVFVSDGVIGTQLVAQTEPVTKHLLIRGGNAGSTYFNLRGTFDKFNLKLFRSGLNRPQISREWLRETSVVACNSNPIEQPPVGIQGTLGCFWALRWPQVICLDPNEVLQVKFQQATTADIQAPDTTKTYTIGWYCLAVDPGFKCEPEVRESIERQVRNQPLQRPLYLHLATENAAGNITFPAIAINQRVRAITIEAPENLLVLGFYVFLPEYDYANVEIDQDIPRRNTKIQMGTTGGNAFSRKEVFLTSLLDSASPMEWMRFEFMMPHFLRAGDSMSASLVSDVLTLAQQMESSIVFDCVTV